VREEAYLQKRRPCNRSVGELESEGEAEGKKEEDIG
jgi:hypothetical protein